MLSSYSYVRWRWETSLQLNAFFHTDNCLTKTKAILRMVGWRCGTRTWVCRHPAATAAAVPERGQAHYRCFSRFLFNFFCVLIFSIVVVVSFYVRSVRSLDGIARRCIALFCYFSDKKQLFSSRVWTMVTSYFVINTITSFYKIIIEKCIKNQGNIYSLLIFYAVRYIKLE